MLTVPPTAGERLRKALSYSQQIALRSVVAKMGDQNEAEVVASDVADANELTRSVVVSALKLAEVAGVLSAVSMGMKGTRIRIHDRDGLDEALAD